MKVAIYQNKEIFNHSTFWISAWVEYCKKMKLNMN
jgi:hypothetical protein